VLLKKVNSYLLGNVKIIVEGYYIERFINKCGVDGINLCDVEREKECIMNAQIYTKDFKKIKKIAKITKCRVKIDKKNGLPFLVHRYRRRKIFLILPVILICFFIVISKFIWNIEIVGNKKISKDEILKLVNDNGIKIGMLKSEINTEKVINEMRIKRDDISWIGISIDGTNAKIEIAEAREKPKLLDKNEYCNIIADKDGIIDKINVKSGTAQVSEGDVVKKGDILVSGIMTGKYTGDRKVHASADIKAKVSYSEKKRKKKTQNLKSQTGSAEKYYQISINNFKINFNKRLSKFENYDTIKNSRKMKILNNFYLPIELTEITNIEMKSEQVVYNAEELKNNTISEIKENLNEKTEEKDIVDENIITEEKNDFIEVKVMYEVLEDIGVEEKLE